MNINQSIIITAIIVKIIIKYNHYVLTKYATTQCLSFQFPSDSILKVPQTKTLLIKSVKLSKAHSEIL